jgi:hypothetical protein
MDTDYIEGFNRIERTMYLVTLNITESDIKNFDLLARLINNCKATLKKLTLGVHCVRPIDGYRLKAVFESCEKLENLVFFVRCGGLVSNMNEYQYSFQSEWWLDARRPSVYIQHNSGANIIFTSMPCQYSLAFKNNLYNWCFNKGDENSSSIRFPETNNIHFTNTVDQLITLEYLYVIDRVFTASNQRLQFDFCHLHYPEIILYMVRTFLYNNKLFIWIDCSS